MEEFHLIVFKFKYTDDIVCLCPVFFEYNSKNEYGKDNQKLLESAILELKNIPGIKDVKIVHNKIANLDECVKTINKILSVDINDDSVRIKYLELEKQIELVEQPKFDYRTSRFYIPIQIQRYKFPIRVRAINFKFLLDETEMPIIIIDEK